MCCCDCFSTWKIVGSCHLKLFLMWSVCLVVLVCLNCFCLFHYVCISVIKSGCVKLWIRSLFHVCSNPWISRNFAVKRLLQHYHLLYWSVELCVLSWWTPEDGHLSDQRAEAPPLWGQAESWGIFCLKNRRLRTGGPYNSLPVPERSPRESWGGTFYKGRQQQDWGKWF